MSFINQIETFAKNPDLIFGFTFNGILLKVFSFLKKFETVFFVSFLLMLITRKFKKVNESKTIENVDPLNPNEALDLYYSEGMKLFSQGPYAKNSQAKKGN